MFSLMQRTFFRNFATSKWAVCRARCSKPSSTKSSQLLSLPRVAPSQSPVVRARLAPQRPRARLTTPLEMQWSRLSTGTACPRRSLTRSSRSSVKASRASLLTPFWLTLDHLLGVHLHVYANIGLGSLAAGMYWSRTTWASAKLYRFF